MIMVPLSVVISRGKEEYFAFLSVVAKASHHVQVYSSLRNNGAISMLVGFQILKWRNYHVGSNEMATIDLVGC